MKNEKPRNQPSFQVPSSTGRTIALKNLRPGDWLVWSFGQTMFKDVVYKNEPALGLLHCIDSRGPSNLVHRYNYSPQFERLYLGRGKKRKWVDMLPKFISQWVCPYSGPRK